MAPPRPAFILLKRAIAFLCFSWFLLIGLGLNYWNIVKYLKEEEIKKEQKEALSAGGTGTPTVLSGNEETPPIEIDNVKDEMITKKKKTKKVKKASDAMNGSAETRLDDVVDDDASFQSLKAFDENMNPIVT
jgi:hypothetical protein